MATKLNDVEKKILVLRLKDGKDWSEVASELGITVDEVGKIYKSALVKLGDLRGVVSGLVELGIIKVPKLSKYQIHLGVVNSAIKELANVEFHNVTGRSMDIFLNDVEEVVSLEWGKGWVHVKVGNVEFKVRVDISR